MQIEGEDNVSFRAADGGNGKVVTSGIVVGSLDREGATAAQRSCGS